MTATALALLLLSAAPSRADVVTFSNGNKMSGVVLKNEGGTLQLQVDDEGFVDLSTDTITGVEKESAQRNEALKAEWRARNAKAAAAEEKDRRLAEEQRAKGLIFYEGEWMKPAEAEARLAEKSLKAATHHQHAQVFMADERTPDIPGPQTTTQSLGYYLLPAGQHRSRRGRVFVFKNGHAVQKRGRVIDLSEGGR